MTESHPNEPDLRVSFAGIELPNPILVASGTFAYGQEVARLYDLSVLGGLVSKTITREPRAGNPPPRIMETVGGMLNSIGLQNPGIDAFLTDYLPVLRSAGCPLIVNVAGEDPNDFVALAERVGHEPGIAAVELNLSCPNVAGGLDFSTKPQETERVVRAVKRVCPLPVFAKLSPNVTSIVEIAMAAEAGGADGLSMINTVVGMAIDAKKWRPVLARGTGGLSGPAIKPVALAAVWRTSQAVKLPIIGIGGIMTATDVVEFLLAGASAVQVGTANFIDPWCAPKIIDGLAEWCRAENVTRVSDLIGALKTDA
jgi:dihydroorotate dehydrogenase (NAD+) catalytic subunit